MISANLDIRVRYQETDQMKVVYHANYFTWFEAARIELLDQINCPYWKLEEDGYLLPVIHCEAKFHRPAHFDDRLVVKVLIKDSYTARIKIYYEVYRKNILLCTGNTTHAFIDQSGKLVRPPEVFIRNSKINLNN